VKRFVKDPSLSKLPTTESIKAWFPSLLLPVNLMVGYQRFEDSAASNFWVELKSVIA